MKKRKLFDEILEGFDALAKTRVNPPILPEADIAQDALGEQSNGDPVPYETE